MQKCHSSADKITGTHTTDEYSEFFKDETVELVKIHEKTAAKKYFNSKKFKKRTPYLKAFFEMHGFDSGNIPSC